LKTLVSQSGLWFLWALGPAKIDTEQTATFHSSGFM